MTTPVYDNTHLRSWEFWRAHNLPALQKHFTEVTRADPEGVRFNAWALCQWHIEQFRIHKIAADELAYALARME